MLRTLIIEDEEIAAKRLQKLVAELLPEAEMLPIQASIAGTVKWLQENEVPDLIFADIQLSDGPCFDIFKQVELDAPVIFTTAFDSYAIHAFKLNSVHYLLKPVKKDELRHAIDKFRRIYLTEKNSDKISPNLEQLLQSLKIPSQYKERFVIRLGDHMHTIDTNQVAYFYTENKGNYLVTKAGKKYPCDFNLDQLETMMNPREFFRINRQFFISFNSIAEMFTYSKARVLIKLNPSAKSETIVSTERSAAFKSWLAGE